MARTHNRTRRRIVAERQLDELMHNQSRVLIIHYSCESFNDFSGGLSPRVTSIAVRRFDNSQSNSFSMHIIAERLGIKPTDISANYNLLERKMLDEFAAFVQRHSGYVWVHWNMRNEHFGFQAIKHRHTVLGGLPTNIPAGNWFSLSSLLANLYGRNFADHPRLESLTHLNEITSIGFLDGPSEAEAFSKGEYIKVHRSTLRKVDILADIINRAWDGTLKTHSRVDQGRRFIPNLVERITQHWSYKLTVFFINISSALKS